MEDPTRKDCKFYDDEADDCKALKMLYCKRERKPCNFYRQENAQEERKG